VTVAARRRAATVVLVAIVLGAAAAVAIVGTSRDDASETARVDASPRCRGLPDTSARECYARAYFALVEGADDPRPAIERITRSARREGGFLLSNCHGIMHTVGRTYARDAGVTLATLKDALPRSNDPGCPAGFAHGVVSGVAPLLDPRRPRDASGVCASAATRYQEYSCTHGLGHAFMRIYDGRLGPALRLCGDLAARAAPDCAQGAYHDYWFAVVGVDEAKLPAGATTDPWRLCAAQPPAFVRPCWYRAFVDNRPAGLAVESAADLDALCEGTRGLQRQGCITAGAVIGPPDPALQLRLCAAIADESDAASCVRGTKVQNLLGASTSEYVSLIRGCDEFAGTARGACYRWLGKTLAVVTDGGFAGDGCPSLRAADARAACRTGALSMNEALETFS
jgi:hypothetical protein